MNDADGRGGCAATPLDTAKSDLRRWARDARKRLSPTDRARFSTDACDRLAASGLLEAGVVSGFWPIGSEINVIPALEHVVRQNACAALPVIVARHRPLIFRQWMPERPMIRIGWLYEPPASADWLTPTVLLTPLLAFDRQGGRLGQGGGFYDRTLAALRRQGPVKAIGVAFGVQEVDKVPVDALDVALDAIVTEREWIACG